MKSVSIEERAIRLAHYIIDNKETVRGAAKEFGISKSTVHMDVSKRLYKINKALAIEVRGILDENKAERHIRGGMATKMKYINEHKVRIIKEKSSNMLLYIKNEKLNYFALAIAMAIRMPAIILSRLSRSRCLS